MTAMKGLLLQSEARNGRYPQVQCNLFAPALSLDLHRYQCATCSGQHADIPCVWVTATTALQLQVVTQISLILLLFGTIVGDFALISDVSARAFTGLAAPSKPPAWLVAYDGRGTMCLFALVAVFPLCCLKGMRQVRQARYTAMLLWNHHVPVMDVFMFELLQTATVDLHCCPPLPSLHLWCGPVECRNAYCTEVCFHLLFASSSEPLYDVIET